MRLRVVVSAKNWFCRTSAFSEDEDSEGRLGSTKFSEVCCFRKSGAIEPLRFQKRAVHSTKIFRRVLLQKIWCYRSEAFSEDEDSEWWFDSTKPSEDCRFRKFTAIEPLCFQKIKMKTSKGDSVAPNFPKLVVSENSVLSHRCAFRNMAVR